MQGSSTGYGTLKHSWETNNPEHKGGIIQKCNMGFLTLPPAASTLVLVYPARVQQTTAAVLRGLCLQVPQRWNIHCRWTYCTGALR